jgi:nucleotide-binding universal stress UspA family protein
MPYHDLTVIGRSAGKRSWSQNLLEGITTDSGRPVLIVPPGTTKTKLDRIALWWKDHNAAARAVTAALPVLGVARKVAVISILENDSQTAESSEDMARQFGWHGIEATTEVLGRDHRPTVNILWSASLAGKVDIVVMGGFSHSRIQEMIFGGCTQAVLEAGVRPVFLLH